MKTCRKYLGSAFTGGKCRVCGAELQEHPAPQPVRYETVFSPEQWEKICRGAVASIWAITAKAAR